MRDKLTPTQSDLSDTYSLDSLDVRVLDEPATGVHFVQEGCKGLVASYWAPGLIAVLGQIPPKLVIRYTGTQESLLPCWSVVLPSVGALT
jgi:hypothetical protein